MSTEEKLRIWFRQNPQEWLSIDDVMEKFQISRNTAYTVMQKLIGSGKFGHAHVYYVKRGIEL